MYHIGVYVPLDYLEKVRDAMFEAGGGKIGSYDSCCWVTKGVGMFRPLSSSKPFIGKENQIEKVDEYKLELVVSDENLKNVIKAMKKSHSYETPAFHYFYFNENI